MRKILILTVASALTPLAAVADEDREPEGRRGSGAFQRWDANSDGVVTRAELEASAAERARKQFDSLDADRDGSLTPEEVRQARERKRTAMREKAQEHFKSADADGDGSLSREEAARGLPQIGRHFERLDADQNGALSAEEFASMRKHREGRRAR